VGTELQEVLGATTVPACRLLVASSVGRCLAPSQCPVIFWSLMEELNTSFLISISRVYLTALWSVFSSPRSTCRFIPQSLIPSTIVMPASNDHDSQVVQETHSGSALRWSWQPPAGTCHRFEFFFFSWLQYPVARCWSPTWFSSTPIVSSYVITLGSPCRRSEAWPCGVVSTCVAFACGAHL
jgi:hypothetical protein